MPLTAGVSNPLARRDELADEMSADTPVSAGTAGRAASAALAPNERMLAAQGRGRSDFTMPKASGGTEHLRYRRESRLARCYDVAA